MANMLYGNRSRTLRVLASLVPVLIGLVMLLVFIGATVIVSGRIDGLTGAALGALAGALLALGLRLAYMVAVDASNLRVLRRFRHGATATARGGEVLAFEGRVRVDGARPMVSPFTHTPCAAYTYRISRPGRGSSRRSTRHGVVIAEGFHMMRCRIDGAGRSLRLASFPGVETDWRHTGDGRRWGEQVSALFDATADHARPLGDRARMERLIELRSTQVEEVHEDHRMAAVGENPEALVIEEEALPAGQRVCAIGSYDENLQALTARRSRLGDNLMLYRGGVEEVLQRVGREVRGFGLAAAAMTGVGASIIAAALWWPAPW